MSPPPLLKCLPAHRLRRPHPPRLRRPYLPGAGLLLTYARTLRLLPIAALLASTACRGPLLALGHAVPDARAHADTLLRALGARFGPHDRDVRLETIRPKVAKSALTPSRIFDDNALWTSHTGSTRALEIAGSGTPGHYRLFIPDSTNSADDTNNASTLVHPGDYHRELELTQLGHDEYEWVARDELAIGTTLTGDDLGRALDALFTAAERGDEQSARTAYRTQLPRTTATLSTLFSLDTLHLAPNASGGTNVHLAITVHDDRMVHDYPHYAKYLDKYLSPSGFNLTVYDDAGHEWWRASKDGDRIALDLRVHDGSLAPLEGAPARIPDRVHVRIDASTKAWIFRVGVRELVGDVVLTGAPHEKSFVARFRREPEWQLPPLVERMLRTPLRRPFEGNGAMLSFGVRDGAKQEGDNAGSGPAEPTVAVREYQLAVQESRIMRWFGRLGNSAITDFREGAEEEFDRFNGSIFAALDADALALVATSSEH